MGIPELDPCSILVYHLLYTISHIIYIIYYMSYWNPRVYVVFWAKDEASGEVGTQESDMMRRRKYLCIGLCT